MNNLKSTIIIPVVIGMLTLAGCSQRQNDPKGQSGGKTISSKVTKNAGANKNKGAKTGKVVRGGASGVRSNHRENFNHKQAGGMNRADGSDLTLAGLKDPNNLLSQRIIYFDYDRATIRPEYMVLINTHAKLAAKFPQLKMRLEGHADERGSREYNVALSDNRAKSVRRIMGTQGARASQIRTIGYGEEVPIVAGKGERSWQKNRRVEIKYDNH
jgi:peptidoglycan-associated lipoprotein